MLPLKFLRLKVFLLYYVVLAFRVLVRLPHCFLRNHRTLWTLYIPWSRLEATACKQGNKSDSSGMMSFCSVLFVYLFSVIPSWAYWLTKNQTWQKQKAGWQPQTCHVAGHRLKSQTADQGSVSLAPASVFPSWCRLFTIPALSSSVVT